MREQDGVSMMHSGWWRWTSRKAVLAGLLSGAMLVGAIRTAQALPSYAQQTGEACVQCHTSAFGPVLTAEGRRFKLNGYADGDRFSIPLSAVVTGSLSHINKPKKIDTGGTTDQPGAPADQISAFGYRENAKPAFDAASLYLAGRITRHVGLLAEGIYTKADRRISLGNVDVRYARKLTLWDQSMSAGVSLNNNPTVQDLWSSTPARSSPWVVPYLVPPPMSAPVLAGRLSHRVLGVSAHTMINDRYYVELGAYQPLSHDWLTKFGRFADTDARIVGTLPYWRTAVQFQPRHQAFSVGLFGLRAKLKPDITLPENDHYHDEGVDATYQFIHAEDHVVSVEMSWLRERRRLQAEVAAGTSDAEDNKLFSRRIHVAYTHFQTTTAGITWFDIRGTRNTLLFPADLSTKHSPLTRGYTLQFEYAPFGKADSLAQPWFNWSLGVQHTAFQQFAGDRAGYNASGRNANDNDTTIIYVRTAF